MLELVEYSTITEAAYSDYITEWETSGELIVPSATRRKGRNFASLQAKWERDTREAYTEELVPASLFFLINKEQRILGAIHFRHQLNQRLLQNGGHIGYGVRPSERRKGYATIMLELVLREIESRGYDKVMVTCDDENIGSVKTIEKAGGVLQDRLIFEGTLTRRYWISL